MLILCHPSKKCFLLHADSGSICTAVYRWNDTHAHHPFTVVVSCVQNRIWFFSCKYECSCDEISGSVFNNNMVKAAVEMKSFGFCFKTVQFTEAD